jgi:ABC-type lipoprotein release transport system permease subunit
VARRIIAGRYPQPGRAQILIGKACADTLGLAVGATLNLMTDPTSTARAYRVSGIFATGIEHFDAQFTYIADPHLDETLAAAATTEYAFFFHPGASIPKATAAIGQQLPPTWQLKRWDQLMPDLVQLIDLNEISMQIIMVLVVVLVGFGISNTFILTIVERYREFGILKAMGVTPHELTLLIFLESFLVCAGAALLGLLIGWGLTTGLGLVGIDLSAFTSHNRYFVVTGVVHPRLTYGGLLGPGLLVVLVSLISSYLPTRMAGRRITADILRFS